MAKPYPTNRKSPARSHGCARKKGRSPEYTSWLAMRSRCYQPSNNRFPTHGGRGIIVCDRWRDSFENFLADMGPKPSPRHSIDRFPDQNGNYEPGNCRWATPQEQTRNTRRNLLLTLNGRTMCLAAWAQELNIKSTTIQMRIRRGWSHELALLTPVG